MIKEDIKFDFDDFVIEPAIISEIESRKTLITRDKNGMLPLFAAPMDTVVDLSNYKIFLKNGIRVVLPRTVDEKNLPYDENNEYLWFSYGLNDIDELFLSDKNNKIQNILKEKTLYILIDVANGHMKQLHDRIILLKEKFKDNIQLMVGNIANPETYKYLSGLGVWGIRTTIGNGSACLTSEKTAISYPSASLIKECYEISCTLKNPANIIMDGGLKDERDFIKSFALGCFLPNMNIHTNIGYKNIEYIEKGDYVYSHTGNLNIVLDKFIYENNKNIVSINNDIFSTDNHNFYVINKKYKDVVNDKNIHKLAEWIPAKKLSDEYFLIEQKTNTLNQILKLFKKMVFKFNIYIMKKNNVLYEKSKTNNLGS
jgi:hypothetical protein